MALRHLIVMLALLPSAVYAQRVADLEASEGEVTLNPARDPKLSLAPKLGDDIFMNDVMTTEAKAKARLRFIDTSIISLGENTRLRISKLVFDPAKTRDAELNLDVGLALFEVGKLFVGSFFQVVTPFGTFRAKGTVFTVEVSSDKARLSVFDGTVEYLSLTGATISVSAGQSLEVTATGASTTLPIATPPAEEGKLLTAVASVTPPLLPALGQLALIDKTLALPLAAPLTEILHSPLLKPVTAAPSLLGSNGLLQRTLTQPALGLNLGLSTLLSSDQTAGVNQVVVTTK